MTATTRIYSLPAAQYHADPCDEPSLSASIAHILCTATPAHAWAAHPRLNPRFEREDEQHFDIGTVAHALLLEGGADAVEVIDAPDWRTKAAKDARDDARSAGRVPLLSKHWAAVDEMVGVARASLDRIDADPPLFEDGAAEQVLVWEEDGAVCRSRLDWLHNDNTAIDDYKTTGRTANPDTWSRSLFSFGGDVQAAFYLRGLRKVTGMDAVFRFVVQETFPPYALSVVGLSPDVLALAEAKVERAIKTWASCMETHRWPAYPRQVCHVELPAWEEPRWLEREAREEEAA